MREKGTIYLELNWKGKKYQAETGISTPKPLHDLITKVWIKYLTRLPWFYHNKV